MSIEKIVMEQRPRERMLRRGAAGLSEIELLALLFRSGSRSRSVLEMAGDLLAECGSLEGLARMGATELMRRGGIGPAKACSLVSALELGRRLAAEGLREMVLLDRPEKAGEYLVAMCRGLRREVFGCIFLDGRNRVLKARELWEGTRDTSPVEAAELFRQALFLDASRIILYHNHPSGNLEPSFQDLQLTGRLARGGEILGLAVVDHLILAGPKWISLRTRRPEIFDHAAN